MSELKGFQKTFIELALQSHALEFGKFKLKSGRDSPYFFNAAKMLNGCDLFKLANCYVDAIQDLSLEFDCLYGPAYKGIFLGSIVATAFSQRGKPYPLSFNRKEIKDHGEGGTIIRAAPAGNVLIIDDVITAGTAIREVMAMVDAADAQPAGVVIGLDRKERGNTDKSAIQEVEQQFDIPVVSIIDIDDILAYLDGKPDMKLLVEQIKEYRQEYGL